MQLQVNEIVLYESKLLVISNQRIDYHIQSMGNQHHKGINLEDISSLEVKAKGYLILLILSIFCFVGGLAALYQNSDANGGQVGIGMALGLLLLWYFIKEKVLAVQPHGGKALFLNLNGFNKDEVGKLFDIIMDAKNSRFNLANHITK